MVFLASMGILLLILKGVEFERHALEDFGSYGKIVSILGIAAVCARWRTVKAGEGAALQFEDEPAAEVFVLGLYRDGVLPIEPGPYGTSFRESLTS